MDGKTFTRLLIEENRAHWARVQEAAAHMAVTPALTRADIVARLKAGRYNERRNAEVCARWFLSTPEDDVRLGLARQIWDETRHHKLLGERLRALGEDPDAFAPLPEWEEMYARFAEEPTTVERLAGMQFVGEALQCDANERWIERALAVDPETATLYRDKVQPDEKFHAALGRTTLVRYATTREAQALARAAAARARDLVARAFMAYNAYRDRLRDTSA